MKTAVLSTAAVLPSNRGSALAIAALSGAILVGLAVAAGRSPGPRWDLLLTAAPMIRVHVFAAVLALGIGGALLIGAKGRALHKALGWTWVAAMTTVAVSSIFIQEIHPGRYSWIHLFSGWTLIALPMAIAAIKRRSVRLHRRIMTALFVGGLVIAGAFTFVPGRLMWRVFLG